MRHHLYGRAVCALLCALLVACGSSQATGSNPAPTAPPPAAPAVTQAPTAAAAALIDPARPCIKGGGATPAATGAPAGVEVVYEGDSETIRLRAGQSVTLAALGQALGQPELLRELAPGEWLLGANLVVEAGAELQIAAPAVRWLKLRSDSAGFAAIRVLGGQLSVTGSCVTSWDEGRARVDEDHSDGRSFMLARDGATMAISGAELRYLGHDADESFGLAWRLEGTSGQIIDSVVSHNFYGMYSYGASGLVIRGSEFHHNVLYGIDPHTNSNRLQIEGNLVHDNGKHGIILADHCQDSVIRDNIVYNNLHHGIVLYQGSDRNLVEGNQSYQNGAQGININDSSDNTVRANLVYGNLEDGVGVGQDSRANTLIDNEIRANLKDGIVVYSDAADTTIRANQISDNVRYGVYLNSKGAVELVDNTVFGSQIGLYLKQGGPPPAPEANRVYNNREADISEG